ncbi:MAG: hypothetical protein JNL82_15385 [Myxococcales bacterium]|nr:hypothetical protein [Myxococcales bacterium]
MNRASCLKQATIPSLSPHEQLVEGVFLRNLEPKRLKRFNPKTKDVPPDFGWRVLPHDWPWTDKDGTEGLSVNLQACTGCSRCSILLQGGAPRFSCVIKIDLSKLCELLGFTLVAEYDPVTDEPENPCHFVLLGVDCTPEDILIALEELDKQLKVLNANNEQIRLEYQHVFEVLSIDGEYLSVVMEKPDAASVMELHPDAPSSVRQDLES